MPICSKISTFRVKKDFIFIKSFCPYLEKDIFDIRYLWKNCFLSICSKISTFREKRTLFWSNHFDHSSKKISLISKILDIFEKIVFVHMFKKINISSKKALYFHQIILSISRKRYLWKNFLLSLCSKISTFRVKKDFILIKSFCPYLEKYQHFEEKDVFLNHSSIFRGKGRYFEITLKKLFFVHIS